jgi:hypothetical protein
VSVASRYKCRLKCRRLSSRAQPGMAQQPVALTRLKRLDVIVERSPSPLMLAAVALISAVRPVTTDSQLLLQGL